MNGLIIAMKNGKKMLKDLGNDANDLEKLSNF